MNSQKKFAILIMAHDQFSILEKLLIMLDHERNDIYVHIDKKSKGFDQKRMESVCNRSKITFIPSMSVFWGDSSMVECELRLMESALASGEEYSYFHLLSGRDLQIKSNEEIMDFFDRNPDRQFLALRYAESGIGGMSRYYYFMRLRHYNKYLAKALDIVSARIQRLMKVNRLKDADFKICKCQQWFSITAECAAYVVQQRKFIEDFTRHTICSDEMFLGTVIVNSPFAEQIYHPYRSLIGHMRLIDRERAEKASPHTWVTEDWNMIVQSPGFWARKFDLNRDCEIVDRVFNEWKPEDVETSTEV